MAISAYDKTTLSQSQQNEIARVTQAAQSGKMSWSDAHSAAESVRASAGYSGGNDGSGSFNISSPKSSSSSSGSYSGGSQGNYTSQPVNQATPSTDYAQEIINMLTSGGSIDYDRLNGLASSRDAKINSDPSRYSNVESTQSLINKYLPMAQLNESLQAQVNAKNNQESQQIQQLTDLLKQLGSSGINKMSFNEAQTRAESELNPMYNNAKVTLTDELNKDMERRGIYNSPLASGIMTEKQGSLSNEQAAAIANRANTLIQNDAELSLQEKQLQSTTINNLLSQLIGKQISTAELTGYLNGQNTLDRDKYDTDTKLQEGQLTGKYNGQDTLAATQTKISSILSAVEMAGKVSTQEQADLLGVPIGTATQAAKQAAAELQESIRQFNAEMNYKQASLAASISATSASSNAQKFANAMQVWQTTGSAPAGILQQYGVSEGTEFSSEYLRSAQGKLEELQAQAELYDAEAEIQFQNRVSSFMKTTGIIDRTSAEGALLAIDATSDAASAKKYANANKSTLINGGANISVVNDAIDKHYGVSNKVNYFTSVGSSTTGNSNTFKGAGDNEG